ncbi:MAG: DinB family protein [Gemmatimonadaceae bacterium]
MHERLAEIMDLVEQRRRELLASFADVPHERLRQRAAPDRWTVAEVLEHLRLVESGVARLISKRVGQAKEAGLRKEDAIDSVMSSFDRHAASLDSAVLESPVPVRPRADVDIDEALEGLANSRDALRAAVTTADGSALGDIKHPHPILGELDLYQWLIFLGHHEARHCKQIERTINSISE